MSNIKECFISRHKGGGLVEMDYSQLEIIGLAVLSKDTQLKEDIQSGIDMHCMNAANMYNDTYLHVELIYKNPSHADHSLWKQRRQIAKVFSFQLQYGSGAQNMAESQGVHIKVAEEFIAQYYDRYKGVKKWQDRNIAQVKQYCEPTGKKSKLGFPVNKGYLQSPTGRTYEFIEYDSPEFMKKRGTHTSFSPTQIKNYPVQGFSTGDIVPLALGEIMKYVYMQEIDESILLINTIHDSFIFDVPSQEDFPDLFLHIWNLMKIMKSIYMSANNLWPEVDFDLPLGVDVKTGSNWGNMTKTIIHFSFPQHRK